MNRPELYTQCPVCNRRVALGLYGRVIPWHRNRDNRKCKGEGRPANGKQTKE